MKTTITILGIAASVFATNAKAAAKGFSTTPLAQQELAAVAIDTALQQNQFPINNSRNDAEDITVFNPDAVLKANYSKTTEEVIAENKAITEAPQETAQPLALEMTQEDKIVEENQIIESTVSNEVHPLDFIKINRSLKSKKTAHNNLAATVDLKL